MRKVCRILLVLACAVSIGVVTERAHIALAKCEPPNPPRSNNGATYQDGWIAGPYGMTIGGVRSDIYNYSPWVQPGRPGTVGWSALESTAGGDWAQVGWEEDPYGNRSDFYQVATGYVLNAYQTWSPGEPVGSTHQYMVLYNNTPGQFTFFVDSRQVASEGTSFTPEQGAIAGEIFSLSSQMPGDTYNNETFTNSYVYAGGWTAFDGGQVNSSPTYFGNIVENYYTDSIWDRDC